MICPRCGASCAPHEAACPACGQPLADAYAHIRSSELVRLSGAALKWAILGLAFGATPSVSPLGIAFSVVALRYARRYARRNGRLIGRALVARRMARAGLIAGIVLSLLQLAALLLALLRGSPSFPRPFPGATPV